MLQHLQESMEGGYKARAAGLDWEVRRHVPRSRQARGVHSSLRLLRPGPVRPAVPDSSGFRRGHEAGAGRARRARSQERSDGRCRRSLRPDHPDHRPREERQQPGQPCDHRGLHLPRPVPRSRHDFRPDVEPGSPARSGVHPQLPDPRARPRQRVRKRAGRIASSLRLHDRRGTDDVPPGGDSGFGGGVGRRRDSARRAPQQSEHRAHRRSPQRREPDRLPVSPRAARLPQQGDRRRQGRARPGPHRW